MKFRKKLSFIFNGMAGFIFLICFCMISTAIQVPILSNNLNKTIIESISKDKFMRSTYLILTKENKTILIDPYLMPKEAELNFSGDMFSPDIITVSHLHFDHYDKKYIDENKLNDNKTIKIIAKDIYFSNDFVNITTIPVSHGGFFNFFNFGLFRELPKNYVYVFEVNGLKIVALGDDGESKFSKAQLTQIGRVDILITKLNNVFFTINCGSESKKSMQLIKQLNPKILIPTHTTKKCVQKYSKVFSGRDDGSGLEMVNNSFAINADEINSTQKRIVFIENTLY